VPKELIDLLGVTVHDVYAWKCERADPDVAANAYMEYWEKTDQDCGTVTVYTDTEKG
jgi:hypothetical protein